MEILLDKCYIFFKIFSFIFNFINIYKGYKNELQKGRNSDLKRKLIFIRGFMFFEFRIDFFFQIYENSLEVEQILSDNFLSERSNHNFFSLSKPCLFFPWKMQINLLDLFTRNQIRENKYKK